MITRVRQRVRRPDFVRVLAPSFVVSTTITTNRTGLVVALTGTNTAWGAGTTFTVSGVAGVSKPAQSVISGTSATITINSGSTTGTLTFSDGSVTATASVRAPVKHHRWFPGLSRRRPR